ncbi:Cloroperoxidase [Aspergillus ellipticus CBS 707.79]|uniref:Cloroperoxidase n=1 Tax=Aspergillus ellipticus CBS 707.79 TaxID=1448320 RepID=A0A319DSP8_9EURO|nr:Cloroperoxidase [Aspergillus ellipticus CBS 707.79]
MKLVLSTTLLSGLALASPHFGAADISHWMPAGASDFRGPCPMLNTLANHNFLPHDGRNITREKIIDGLGSALNFDSSLASLMFDMAIVVNPQSNATWFTLDPNPNSASPSDQLNQHNILEHDASLSRSDFFFGNNHVFNQTIFNQTRQYWTNSTLTAQMLANSKLARQITSRTYNPTYTFTGKTQQFSLGELSAPIIAFGNMSAGTVDRALVEYFFEHERLPTELGWKTKADVVALKDILRVSEMISNATDLITDPSIVAKITRRGDLHSGGSR